MSSTLTSTPVIDALMAAIFRLSREEKVELLRRVRQMLAEEEISSKPLENVEKAVVQIQP